MTGIEQYIKNIGILDELDNFYYLKEEYMRARAKVLSLLNANMLRGKDIDDIKREKVISDINDNNTKLKLACFINKLITLPCNKSEKSNKLLVNYALEAKAYVDSEYVSEKICFKASNAINGKWDELTADMWRSDGFEEEHWLMIDMNKSHSIQKFIIRHHFETFYITVDYNIQGSNDGDDWDILVNVQGNKSAVSTHEIKPSMYRYIKLFISKPCNIDIYARIYEFEVWGQKEC